MTFVQRLQTVLRAGDQLPALPTVVLQLHAVLDRESAGPGEIARVIEADPAITARLLRAANAASVSRGGDRVASVATAVQRLGVSQVRALCMVVAVVQAFENRGGSLDHRAFWAHSGAVGGVARVLWLRFGNTNAFQGGVSADDVYVAGLLHDVGLLMLDQFFPADFTAVLTASRDAELPWFEHEEHVLGMEHGDLGGFLLGSWNFPPSLVDGVTFHHRVGAAPPTHFKLCLAVQAAESFASDFGFGLPLEGRFTPDVASALLDFGVPEADVPALLVELTDIAGHARTMFD